MFIRLDLWKIQTTPLKSGKILRPLTQVFLVRNEETFRRPTDFYNRRGNAEGSRQSNRLRVSRHEDFG